MMHKYDYVTEDIVDDALAAADASGKGHLIHRDDMYAALLAVADDLRRDNYHTMEEVYTFRMLYQALAVNSTRDRACKSWRHADGERCFGGGWFVVYVNLPTGQISNHYKAEYWELFKVPEVDKAPEWDGHTSQDVVKRLFDFLTGP